MHIVQSCQESDECCRSGLDITLYASQANVTCIKVMEVVWRVLCSFPRGWEGGAGLIYTEDPSIYTAGVKALFFSHRNSRPVSYWPPAVVAAVMTLRCCRHTSVPHGCCVKDDTKQGRSHNLCTCSIDSVSAELWSVDTKWLSHPDRQKEAGGRRCVIRLT